MFKTKQVEKLNYYIKISKQRILSQNLIQIFQKVKKEGSANETKLCD